MEIAIAILATVIIMSGLSGQIVKKLEKEILELTVELTYLKGKYDDN